MRAVFAFPFALEPLFAIEHYTAKRDSLSKSGVHVLAFATNDLKTGCSYEANIDSSSKTRLQSGLTHCCFIIQNNTGRTTKHSWFQFVIAAIKLQVMSE